MAANDIDDLSEHNRSYETTEGLRFEHEFHHTADSGRRDSGIYLWCRLTVSHTFRRDLHYAFTWRISNQNRGSATIESGREALDEISKTVAEAIMSSDLDELELPVSFHRLATLDTLYPAESRGHIVIVNAARAVLTNLNQANAILGEIEAVVR